MGYRRVLKRTEPCEGCWLGRIEKQANHYVPVLRVRGGNKQGTAQAILGGALAYASDGELQLRIADSVVSTTIDGQVRERVAPAVHRLDRAVMRDLCRPALSVAWQRVLNGPPSNPYRLLLQSPGALGYTNRIGSMLNLTNSSVTLNSDALATLSPEPSPGIGASTDDEAPSLLKWDGHVLIAGDTRWVSKGAHRIVVGELKADSLALNWGN